VFLVYGIIALLAIGFLVMFVYVRKPKYGIELALVVCLLVLTSSYFYLSEDSRVIKSEQKVLPNELVFNKLEVSPAYGSYYKIVANLTNQSEDYQVISILLRLTLKNCEQDKCSVDEKSEKRVKVWLKSESSKTFETYIGFEKLAKQRSAKEWQLEIVSSQAK